jgi:hypothetical protein
MKNQTSFGWTLSVLVLVGAKNLQAAPERFGDKGQLVLDERFKLAGTYDRTQVNSDFTISNKAIAIAPGASYFIAPRLSLGLQVLVSHVAFDTKTKGAISGDFHNALTQVGIAPSVGYAVPLSDQLSFWPQAAVQYTKGWTSGGGWFDANGNTNASTIAFKATMPLLWSPATHFFVGIGPQASFRSGALGQDSFKNGTLSLGVSSLIGGNFTL